MKRIAWLLLGLAACPPTPPPPPSAPVCASIAVPSIGPGSGNQTLCVLPSECRLDTMSDKIAAAFCADKSLATCPAGNASCSNACAGTVVTSSVKAISCVWDRNSECKLPGGSGASGGNCNCEWQIQPGGSLACGCGCK